MRLARAAVLLTLLGGVAGDYSAADLVTGAPVAVKRGLSLLRTPSTR